MMVSAIAIATTTTTATAIASTTAGTIRTATVTTRATASATTTPAGIPGSISTSRPPPAARERFQVPSSIGDLSVFGASRPGGPPQLTNPSQNCIRYREQPRLQGRLV